MKEKNQVQYTSNLNNKGITLLALVITIIILLILAGISIASLKNSGLFGSAKKAKEENLRATVQERIALLIYDIQMEFIQNGKVFNRDSLTQEIFQQKDENISNYGTIEAYVGTYTINNQKIKFKINEDLSVTVGNTESSIIGSLEPEVDDVEKWIQCASLQDRYNYTTMDQVLADDTCIRELMNSKNAVDYMVRSRSVIMPAILNNVEAITILAQNEYAGYKAINDEQIRLAIFESENVEHFDNNSRTPQNASEGLPVYSSYQSNQYKPEYAFDGNKTTQWHTTVPNGAYIGYDFEEPINIYKVTLKKGPTVNVSDYYVETGHIQYSDDGENWINVSETQFETTAGDTTSSFFVNNVGEHQYWRITCESSRWERWDQVAVGELEMYGRNYNTNDEWYDWANLAGIDGTQFNTINDMVSDNNTVQTLMSSNAAVDYMINSNRIRNAIMKSENAISVLNNNSYALEKVITNDIWFKAIMKSEYADKLDENSKTPQNIGKGSPVYSSYGDNVYKPEFAFDGDKTTQWWTNIPNGAYIGYDFGESINIYKITLKKGPYVIGQSDYYVKTGHIQYSDDGENWINASDTQFETAAGDTESSFVINAGSHRYWRITCESSRHPYWDQVAVGELEMYGKIFK